MEASNSSDKKSSFTQAQFSQERLHQLLANCDSLSATPLIWDDDAQDRKSVV